MRENFASNLPDAFVFNVPFIASMFLEQLIIVFEHAVNFCHTYAL